MESSETKLTAIFLNFILENYTLELFNFNLISKDTKSSIEKLIKKYMYQFFLISIIILI